MLRIGLLLCTISVGAASALQAAELLQVEKLTKEQLRQALKAASDVTPIEYRGQTKTKAEWRGDFQAKYKPPDASTLQALSAENKARFDAVAKAVQDEQTQKIAKQNAEVAKELEALKALGNN